MKKGSSLAEKKTHLLYHIYSKDEYDAKYSLFVKKYI